MTQIVFLGAGNMAEALISGLISSKIAQPTQIKAIDTQPKRRSLLEDSFGIRCLSGLGEIDLADAQVLVLALKPQVLLGVLQAHQQHLALDKLLLVSVAAGITCEKIQNCLLKPLPTVRCMPNTPSHIGQGMNALYANDLVSPEQKTLATRLLSAVGATLWLEQETLLNAATAISGSGPAYFYYLMEAMINAGENLGLSTEQSRQLVLQTALGTSNLALSRPQTVKTLREQVTSPGGTTQAAMTSLDSDQVMQAVERAVQAATKRSIELSE